MTQPTFTNEAAQTLKRIYAEIINQHHRLIQAGGDPDLLGPTAVVAGLACADVSLEDIAQLVNEARSLFSDGELAGMVVQGSA